MSTLHQAVIDVLDEMWGVPNIPENEDEAYTILAMPEMAAIRDVIHAVGMFGIGVIDSDAMLAAYYELPESVCEWVHGDEVAMTATITLPAANAALIAVHGLVDVPDDLSEVAG